MLIQESPAAGFHFRRGDVIWPSLTVGAPLALMRELNDSHDANVVVVYYQNHKPGYVPRGESSTIAQMLDHGERLKATIIRLSDGEGSRGRIRFGISLV